MRRVRCFGTISVLLSTATLLCVAAGGCVHRRMTIRSNPPGATVFIDNQPIGETPVSSAFTYYGTREVRLEKAGFETLNEKHKFAVPWYEYPPLDFISENLWPFETRDERILDFQMYPQQIVPESQLRERAEELRANARRGTVAPMPNLPAPRPL